MIDRNYGITYEDDGTDSHSLIDPGTYECVIDKVQEKTMPVSGKQKLQFTFRIRKDVEQKFQGRCVFEDVWANQEGTAYNKKKLNWLFRAVGTPSGSHFDNIDAVIAYFTGKAIAVTVDRELDTYGGRNQEVNVNKNFMLTTKPLPKPQTVGSQIPSTAKEFFADDDLPF